VQLASFRWLKSHPLQNLMSKTYAHISLAAGHSKGCEQMHAFRVARGYMIHGAQCINYTEGTSTSQAVTGKHLLNPTVVSILPDITRFNWKPMKKSRCTRWSPLYISTGGGWLSVSGKDQSIQHRFLNFNGNCWGKYAPFLDKLICNISRAISTSTLP
jgi:hypothetical protein